MWNECFSSKCFLTPTVSWCEVKVWGRLKEKRGCTGWRASRAGEAHEHPERRQGRFLKQLQPSWKGPWWSHQQRLCDFKGFLLRLPLLLPCVRASALGTVPTLHCKIRLEFLTVPLPRHKLQLRSFLHPANPGGGTPLGALPAIFMFPASADLFLRYQICFVH